MKRVCVLLLLLAGLASADTVTLKFVSETNGQIGPYHFLVNGTTHDQLVCFSDKNFIDFGESWTAEVFTIGDVSNITGPFAGTTEEYNEIGLLSDQLFLHPGDVNIQNAIWAVLGTGPAPNAWDTWAIDYLNAHPDYATGDLFYIPVGDFSKYRLGVPQPFAGQSPEPSMLVLVGSGLLGIAGLVRKKVV